MPLALLDLTLPTLAKNLALDEALLLEAEEGAGGEVLRFWEWPAPAVVLGAGGRIAVDVDEAACQRDGVPVQRRASGGGTVLLGSGCLLFSLVLRMEGRSLRDIHASYGHILSRLCAALQPLISGELMGVSDLAASGRKFSGNAQQRKRDHLLHHGTLLYGFDLAQIARYLRMPEKQPDYRENRPHDSFLMNLPADAGQLRRLLIDEWQAAGEPTAIPTERIGELIAEKYGRTEWIWKR